jgi:hypothetical protein
MCRAFVTLLTPFDDADLLPHSALHSMATIIIIEWGNVGELFVRGIQRDPSLFLHEFRSTKFHSSDSSLRHLSRLKI